MIIRSVQVINYIREPKIYTKKTVKVKTENFRRYLHEHLYLEHRRFTFPLFLVNSNVTYLHSHDLNLDTL